MEKQGNFIVKGKIMSHSTVTSKGQTTIPGEVREALNIQPGDRLEYAIEGKYAKIRVHPGLGSLKGALRSDKGAGMSFSQIRETAAAVAMRGRKK
jgi:AbrB family looped-hinge helix DNA binding protein